MNQQHHTKRSGLPIVIAIMAVLSLVVIFAVGAMFLGAGLFFFSAESTPMAKPLIHSTVEDALLAEPIVTETPIEEFPGIVSDNEPTADAPTPEPTAEAPTP